MSKEEKLISTEQAAKMKKVTSRRIRSLCEQGRVPGAKKVGKAWVLPAKFVVIASEANHNPNLKIKMKKG